MGHPRVAGPVCAVRARTPVGDRPVTGDSPRPVASPADSRQYEQVQRWVLSVLIASVWLAGCTNDGSAEDAASTSATGAPTSLPSTTTISPGCTAPEPELQRPELDTTVKVFLFCNGGVMPVDLHPATRVVPNDGAPLRAAMTQLLLGVTPAEASAGMQSAFSAYTADTLRGVTVKSGVATVDLTRGFERTNNFSTTNLSGVVFSQIEATVLQFPDIQGIEFAIDGRRWCGWEAGDDCPAPLFER